MERETSCINSKAILDYLSAHGVDYSQLISNLDPEIDRQDDPERFLRDPDNWISTGVLSDMFRRATELLNDDQTAYKIGCYVTENKELGFVQRILVKAFWSTKNGLRYSQKINDQWNRSKKVELLELKRNQATVRLHWDPTMQSSKYICMYNQALYTHLPKIWNGKPLTLDETCCQFDGAPYCEYHLKWPLRNRLHEIISHFVTSKSVLRDTIQEMERDKEIIHQKNDELRSVNTALHDKIIALRKSEQALKESREHFQKLLDIIPDMISVQDPNMDIVYSNWMGFANVPQDKRILKTKCYATYRGYDRICPDCKAKRVLESKRPFQTERELPDGTWIDLRVIPILDGQGKVAFFMEWVRDITEAKRAEEALKASEEKHRLLFENANDAIFIAQEGMITFANPRAQEIIKSSSAQSDRIPFADFIHPEDRDIVLERHFKRLRGEEVPNIYAFRVFDRSGEEISVELNSVFVEWEGKPATLNFLRDVTVQKRLEARLHQAQKMESLGLLAGGVAHDLNNILSGIVSYPELLLADLPEESPLKQPIKTMQEAGMRAADVVADLLTITRGVATAKEILNLNVIATDYLHSPEHQEVKRNCPAVDFKTRLDDELLNMRGSATHLRKTLMNLVTNASEAIEGAGKITISTRNQYLDTPPKGHEEVQTGEYAVLTVSDDGSGISSSDVERIFEPFYTKKVIGRSGTGLGLAVVWNTVQDHNGYIDVKTSPKGTTFDLYFPVSREAIADEKQSVAQESFLGNGETILVVDDEKSQREIASSILTKLRYRVEAVSSGEEAIAYIKEHSVDLIVLDMVMPKGMNGRETYEEIINIRPGQKAVIASGYAKTKDVDAVQSLGAGRYIKKPYTLEGIGLTVQEELKTVVS